MRQHQMPYCNTQNHHTFCRLQHECCRDITKLDTLWLLHRMSYQHLSGCLYTRPVQSQLGPTWLCIPAAIKTATPKHNDQQVQQGDKGNQSCHKQLCKIQIAQTYSVCHGYDSNNSCRLHTPMRLMQTLLYAPSNSMPVQCCVLNISGVPKHPFRMSGNFVFPFGKSNKSQRCQRSGNKHTADMCTI